MMDSNGLHHETASASRVVRLALLKLTIFSAKVSENTNTAVTTSQKVQSEVFCLGKGILEEVSCVFVDLHVWHCSRIVGSHHIRGVILAPSELQAALTASTSLRYGFMA
jgi:hypothetical protein